MSSTSATSLNPNPRLTSLDAYRGLIMLLLCSGGLFAIGSVNSTAARAVWEESPRWSWMLKIAPTLERQFRHVDWTGCVLWDLIQPSFMFMAGVSMPFSFQRRKQLGQTQGKILRHTLFRGLFLVVLGVLLRSKTRDYINFTFIDVVAQIGLAYFWVALCVGRPLWLQLTIGAAILVGDWYAFYQHPLPPADFDYLPAVEMTYGKGAPGVADFASGAAPLFTGYAAHWNPGTNWAVWADARLLNLFPRPEQIVYTDGSYSTFNFIPSIVTLLIGVIAGELLLSTTVSPGKKTLRLLLAGLGGLALGMALDSSIWPDLPASFPAFLHWKPTWTVCPIVKKIWTPTWVIFSSGWCLLFLGAFYWIVDVVNFKKWTYPLLVLGTNSILIYVLTQVFGDWIKTVLRGTARLVLGVTTPGQLPADFAWATASISHKIAYALYSNFPGQTLRSFIAFSLFWLILAAMYRRKMFVRI